jgi:hypothetical protein
MMKAIIINVLFILTDVYNSSSSISEFGISKQELILQKIV